MTPKARPTSRSSGSPRWSGRSAQFKVVDAKTGEDLTRGVLAQIIMDEEARGTTMLPVNFLRQLISMYGDQMQSVVPQYLEASLEQLQRNQSQFRDAMAGAFAANPFAEIARRNMEMFTAGRPAAKARTRPRRAERQQGRAGRAQGPARRAAAEARQAERLAVTPRRPGPPDMEARAVRPPLHPALRRDDLTHSGFTNRSVIRSLSPIAR